MWYIIKKQLAYGIIPVVVAIVGYRPHKCPKDCKIISEAEFKKLL